MAEPLEEVTYFDQLHLVAYDHPQSWEIYPDERFGGTTAPTGRPWAIANKVFPLRATNPEGKNVRAEILDIDRRYVEPPVDPRFVGFAREHWIELDFGNRLQDLGSDTRLVLCMHGWVEYTYSHVNYAAGQAGIHMRSPRIEIPDENGQWRVVLAWFKAFSIHVRMAG